MVNDMQRKIIKCLAEMNEQQTLRTRDPIATANTHNDELTLDLRKLQPRLHKRLTKRIKAAQAAKIYAATVDIFTLGEGNQKIGNEPLIHTVSIIHSSHHS